MKLLFLILALLLPLGAWAQGIMVIVNDSNPVNQLEQGELEGYFFKKQKQWPDGTPLRFFDREDESEERKIFLRQFVRKTPREVELFWIGQKLYTGHSAPTQVSSDSMIVSLVARFPGAIGYVSQGYPLRKGVKAIEIKND